MASDRCPDPPRSLADSAPRANRTVRAGRSRPAGLAVQRSQRVILAERRNGMSWLADQTRRGSPRAPGTAADRSHVQVVGRFVQQEQLRRGLGEQQGREDGAERSPPDSVLASRSARVPRNKNRARLARTSFSDAAGAAARTLSTTLSESSRMSRALGQVTGDRAQPARTPARRPGRRWRGAGGLARVRSGR
jgi:hypothetical protein